MSGDGPSWQTATNSVEETVALGESLGRSLVGGLQIGLIGPLGAGKTHLVKGIAIGNALGHAMPATSPTFTLMHEYPGRLRLVHVDLYRLTREDELIALGVLEWRDDRSAVVIEWADRFRALIGPEGLWIEMHPCGVTQRSVCVSAVGTSASECLDAVRVKIR